MIEFQTLLRAIEVRGGEIARAGTVRAGDALLAAVVAELPDVAVTREGSDIVLRAPGLHARAFGSRTAMPDPRVAGVVR